MKSFTSPLLALAVAAPLTLATQTANAEIEVSANVALTSDYRFRGISQSDSKPAIQGGFDVDFGNGFYLGTWGSAVDFDCAVDTCGGANGGLELDYYGGFSHEFDGGVGIDVGYIYYDYPQDEGIVGDYEEVYGSVSYAGFTVGAAFSDEYWFETGEITYVYASYELALPMEFSLGLTLGQVDYDVASYVLADKHTHWAVSLGKSFGGLDWALTYEDTDLSTEEAYGYDWADSTVILSVAKSM